MRELNKGTKDIKRKIAGLYRDFKEIEKGGRSVVVRLRRQPFDDPLLTVYFVKGRPIMANSFVVHEPWYHDLLNEKDIERAGGNLVAYAYQKYGDALFENLETYSRAVIERVMEEVNRNGWDFSMQQDDLREEAIKELFGGGKDLKLKVKEVDDTLSILPELNSMGINLILFTDTMEKTGRGLTALRDIHYHVISSGIEGHYLLFFPYTVIVYGAFRGREILGEGEYGPNLLRTFPLLKREISAVPEILKEYPWETSGKVGTGRPLGLYVRYRGRGVLTIFRSSGRGIYPCRIQIASPEKMIKEVNRMRERISDIVEQVMEKIKDRPRSLLRMEIHRYVRSYPHPDDLYTHLKVHFNL